MCTKWRSLTFELPFTCWRKMPSHLSFPLILVVTLWSLLLMVSAGEDFYQLLGVSKSADAKEIRKAFKKLAVTMHPDKNVDDPEAHDKFLKITRAYEVLKDEDLRKKFDTYGEEGLKDDFNRGRHYESWQFYQENFGIYDDDPEIITLSRSDFEQSVEGTDDIWFINFYSPHCSHCHTLAPAWRELAQELVGVIRIGAVNCEDDWHLCRMQSIRSYPSLMMYPIREKYHGEKTTKLLLKHALKQVRASVKELWSGNFDSTVTKDDTELPWLITFCGDGGDCLRPATCLKLAAMLEELVNVGSMDCHGTKNEALCSKLGHDYGTYYYQSGMVEKGEGLEITSLVAQDIAYQVLSQLPDVTILDQDTFESIKDNYHSESWLVHFVEGDGGHDLELRKLPAMLDNIQIGRVDCRQLRTICNDLHVHKFPTFLVFKEFGGYEIYYGRMTAHDVAAFARDSALTRLKSLGPTDFENLSIGPNSASPWFVDFFAPWCPPCMRLLPEFRKAAKSYGEVVSFGTVDCTIHSSLCQMYNIHSYPTTILYNQTVPHQYQGHHRADDIVEFIQDTLSPPVAILDESSFYRLVQNKAHNTIWLIDWFASWCGPCQQMAPEWRRLAKMLRGTQNVFVGQVDCEQHHNLCQQQNVNSYPSLRLYPMGAGQSGSFFSYSGWHRDAQSLRAWAFDHLPSKVEALGWSSFQEQVLLSTDAWIIDFYAPWCGHCQVFKPEFEKVAEQVEGIAKAGKVNCDAERKLCQNAGIRAYPSVRFYPGNQEKGSPQHTYGWDIESMDADQIATFVKNHVPKKYHDEL